MKLISKKTALLSATCLFCFTAPALAATQPAPAQTGQASWMDKLHTDFRVTLQYITEENRDLGTASDEPQDSYSEQLQAMFGYDFTPEWFGFTHIRALNINGETGFDDDEDGSIV